jgi:serine protease
MPRRRLAFASRPVFSLRLAYVTIVTFAAIAAFSSTAHAGLNVMPKETDFTWKAPGYVPDELLVKFKDGVGTANATNAVHGKGGQVRRVLTPDGLIEIKLPAGTAIEDAIDTYSAISDVEYATPNLYAQGFFVPNDTLIAKVDWTWNLRNIGVYDAWDVVSHADPSIVLAIVDTGVAFEDYPIPDYELSHVKPGTTMYRKSPELGPFLPGYDFQNDDAHPNDDHGHGTFMATVAAGASNNIAGSAGIAPGVTILPVKVLQHDNGGEMGPIVEGIRFAADQGADIMNLSLGFPPVDLLRERGFTPKMLNEMFHPLRDAINYARNRGVIIVAASGNFGFPAISLPAGFPGVISVGATGVDNRIASYSDWGHGLSFMAPGGDFTDLNGDHLQDAIVQLSIKPFRSTGSLCDPDSFNQFFFFGTSGASPQVAGAVALLMTQGVRSQGAIEQILRETAIKPEGNPNSYDPVYGNGLIQVGKAVQYAAAHPSLAGGAPRTLGARLTSENPTRGTATLSLRISRPGAVRVQLFDVAGRLVRRLDDGRYPAGERTVRWDGKDERGQTVGSGVYFFRVATPDGVENRRIAVLR